MATGYTGADVAIAYRTARDHLDDIVRLAGLVFARSAASDPAAAATLDLELVDLAEIIEARMAACSAPLPLDRLRTAFQLEATEQRCVWLALAYAVSMDVRVASGCADGLSLEVFDRIVYGSPRVRDRFAAELGMHGRLLRYGLLELDERSPGPRFGRIARIPDAIVELAYGSDRLADDVAGFAAFAEPPTDELLVDPEADHAVRRLLRGHVDTSRGPVPILRGPEGAGKRSLLASIAVGLDARALVVDCRALPAEIGALVALQREAILHRAVLVLANGEAVVGRQQLATLVDSLLRTYPGPLAVTAGPELTSSILPARGTMFVELRVPPEADRQRLWSRKVELPPDLAAKAAARYRLTAGQIARAAAVIRTRSGSIDLAAVHEGVRAAMDDRLAGLGTRIVWDQKWEDLVLPDDSLDELRELIARVRHRRLVVDEWGFGKKVAKGLGLAALFSGPPGTGKTMAAGLVANELGLDLYAVDLSRMVSKYIGETEKNLAQVFDAAEAGHAILLFDEADSLFSKRTEVKSSVDRYANLEVNYLLQRMEAFSGIAILTTNFDTAIDDAFRRRLSYRIAFPLPEEDERARLWRAVIPTGALGSAIDFNALASRFAMSGGYIKNAALRAAFLAAAAGTKIEMSHLQRAATSEYAAMGKVMSMRGNGSGL